MPLRRTTILVSIYCLFCPLPTLAGITVAPAGDDAITASGFTLPVSPCINTGGANHRPAYSLWVKYKNRWFYSSYTSPNGDRLYPGQHPHDGCVGSPPGDPTRLENYFNAMTPFTMRYIPMSTPSQVACRFPELKPVCDMVLILDIGPGWLGQANVSDGSVIDGSTPPPTKCTASVAGNIAFGELKSDDINGRKMSTTVRVNCDKQWPVKVRFVDRNGKDDIQVRNDIRAKLRVGSADGANGEAVIIDTNSFYDWNISATLSSNDKVEAGPFRADGIVKIDMLL